MQIISRTSVAKGRTCKKRVEMHMNRILFTVTLEINRVIVRVTVKGKFQAHKGGEVVSPTQRPTLPLRIEFPTTLLAKIFSFQIG
jgi:hypothetical protein